MKIALFCTNEFPLPLPKKIIYAPLPLFEILAIKLAEKGHKIFLYSSSNSKIKHKNIKHLSAGLTSFDKSGYKNLWGHFHDQEVLAVYQQLLLSQMVKDLKKNSFDIIHIYHNIIHFLPFLNHVNVPVVATLHDPINDKRRFLLKKCAWRNKARYVSKSNNQRKDYPDLPFAATVYNGLEIKNYPFNSKPKDYFVFLGRVCFEKGTHLAVKAAKKAGVHLKVIGPKWGGDKYWNRYIKPNWDDSTMEYLGFLPRLKTRPILKEAKALLFPIQWEEPFGLVLIEAQALGTPVIAFKRGSVPEIIKDGKTGFAVKDLKGMINAINDIDLIDRKLCRENVLERFTLDHMVNDYEKLYRKLT